LDQQSRTRDVVTYQCDTKDLPVRELQYLYRSVVIFLLAGGALSGGAPFSSVAMAAGETPKDILAAQIRSQGIVCDKPQRATRDAKRSKPDLEVWILKCENATYRVSRYPDMAAKVEQLR
jgi:hypothetical protein